MLGPTVVPLSRLAGPKGKDSFKKGEWQEQHQQAFEAAKAAIERWCQARGWRGLHTAKTRVTFGRGPDVMAGARTRHRSARMSRWEGAHATLRSGPVGDSVFFP